MYRDEAVGRAVERMWQRCFVAHRPIPQPRPQDIDV